VPLSAEERKKMPDGQFAVPGKRELPIHDKKHVKLAWDMIDRTEGLSDAEREEARKRIKTRAKVLGIDTSDWEKAATDDVIVAEAQILDSAQEGKPLRVRLKGTRANVINDNNRLYPLDVLQDAVQRFNDRIQSGRAVGESPHPKALRDANGKPIFDTNASRSVWKHTAVFMDADGWVYTDVEMIPTSTGKDVEANIRAGVPVGDSMRAIGRWTTRQIDDRNVQVATHLDIHAFDCVMNEATAGSQVVSVLTDSLVPIADSKLSDILAAGPPMEEGDTVPAQTPIRFAVLDVGQSITDSVQFTDKPIDPSTGEELEPQDPDGDGDVDFYTNPKGEVFMTERRMSHETHAHQYLRKLPPEDDGGNYSLARQWQRNNKPKPATDSRQTGGDDPMPSIEELLASPKLQELIEQRARAIAQPALDSVQTQEQERARQAARAEAESHIQERLNAMKDKFSEKAIVTILDSVKGKAENKEQADVILDAAMELVSRSGAMTALGGLGFTGAANQATATQVQVANEPKPWQPVVDSLVNAFDEYGRELGHEPDMNLRKLNKPIIDRILAKFEKDNTYQQMTDSAAFMDSVQAGTLADSVSITTSQLLNQPTVLEAVVVQAFQDVESTQFMMVDTFDGTEWRVPVETYTSAATFDPTTGLLDIIVSEGQAIPEASTNLNWLSFAPYWRRNAFSMTEDALRGLLTGPAKYPAVARAIYHLGYEKRRRLDLAAYAEMILTSDEYNPTAVNNETPAAVGTNANDVVAVNNGTNVEYKYQLQAAAGSTFPVVRPRTRTEITSASGQTSTVLTNPFTIVVNGATLVPGYLDSAGNVAGASATGATATYAVDWENGIVYFTTGAGITSTLLPTISYSASTNYDTWHYTSPTGERPEDYYNTLLQQMTRTTAYMGSAPRFKKPNTAIMSLNTSAYIENASMWYRLNSPDGSEFTPVTDNNFGKRSGVSFNRINAPWIAGDGRILLSQKGSTRYGIQTPYVMEGPFQKYDPTTGNVIDAKVWYGKEYSVLATPQVTNVSGTVINPVSRTIRIVP